MQPDPLELATFQMQVETERENRFNDSLTDDNRRFVRESTSMRIQLLREIQTMLTETDAIEERASAAGRLLP